MSSDSSDEYHQILNGEYPNSRQNQKFYKCNNRLCVLLSLIFVLLFLILILLIIFSVTVISREGITHINNNTPDIPHIINTTF